MTWILIFFTGQNKIRFIPGLVGPFLEMTLIPEIGKSLSALFIDSFIQCDYLIFLTTAFFQLFFYFSFCCARLFSLFFYHLTTANLGMKHIDQNAEQFSSHGAQFHSYNISVLTTKSCRNYAHLRCSVFHSFLCIHFSISAELIVLYNYITATILQS